MATGLESRGSARQRVWQFAGVEIFAKSTTANTTLTDADARLVYVNATAGAYTIFLPATPYEGMEFKFIENADLATPVEINCNGDTIDGGVMTGISMGAAGAVRRIRFNGTEWRIMEAFR